MPSALANYYAAMADEKNSAARLTDAQTREVADNASSARDVQGAQARNLNATAINAGGLAQSEIGLRSAQAGLTGAQAAALPMTTLSEDTLRGAQASNIYAERQRTLLGNQPLSSFGVNLSGLASVLTGIRGGTVPQVDPTTGQPKFIGSSVLGGAEKGTSKVKAEGKNGSPGKTDTVPMMLAPGEAVLNRGAAEHLGGGVVDHLNKLGMMRMAAQDEVAQHAKTLDDHSVSNVMKQHAKAAKAKRGGRSKAA